MIVWKHHDKVSDELILMIENIVKNHFVENDIEKIYTTYFDKNSNQQYDLLINHYSGIQEKIMKDLGLFHRTKYQWHLWIQMYNNQTDGHSDHDHFSFDKNIIISWVHFIRTPNQKCFYFIDSNGHKTYPDHQSSGDIICFPSWAGHGADKVIEDNFNRLIIAGNIRISYIEQP
jgi:hypothetical protein